jgi:hypothetical protein
MSSGYLSQRFQSAVPVILDGLHLLKIDAELTLNGVPYFSLDGDQELLLGEYVTDRRVNAKRHAGAKWTNISDASGGASA